MSDCREFLGLLPRKKIQGFLLDLVNIINQFGQILRQTNKQKNTRISPVTAKQKILIAYTDLTQFVAIQANPCYRKSSCVGVVGDIN